MVVALAELLTVLGSAVVGELVSLALVSAPAVLGAVKVAASVAEPPGARLARSQWPVAGL